jgi:hypothetical protein
MFVSPSSPSLPTTDLITNFTKIMRAHISSNNSHQIQKIQITPPKFNPIDNS